MRVGSITYRRLVNCSNYENITVEATVELQEGDPWPAAWSQARATVHAALSAQLAEQLDRWQPWPAGLGDDPRARPAPMGREEETRTFGE